MASASSPPPSIGGSPPVRSPTAAPRGGRPRPPLHAGRPRVVERRIVEEDLAAVDEGILVAPLGPLHLALDDADRARRRVDRDRAASRRARALERTDSAGPDVVAEQRGASWSCDPRRDL